jgi:hypothetical protein
MPKDRVRQLLDEFTAVTNAAPRPESPARRIAMTNRLPLGTLTGASLIIVAVAVAAIVLGRQGPGPSVGASASPSDVAVASVQPSGPSNPAPATAKPTATPKPTPKPTVAPCDPAGLAARITLWEGAAGNRIATVELTNTGTSVCLLPDHSRPALIDGGGQVLINGKDTTTSHGLVMAPGAVHTTLVDVANYCGPDPVAPVTVTFAFTDGEVRATPLSPTDATVPPCNGPGQPASIDMHPWSA